MQTIEFRIAQIIMLQRLRGDNKPNLGIIDRIIRGVISFAVFIAIFMGLLVGLIALIPLLLAIYLLITARIAFCPVYKIFNWSTDKK